MKKRREEVMLRRFIVPLLPIVCVLIAAPESVADTPPGDAFTGSSAQGFCTNKETDAPPLQYQDTLTVAACHLECDYSITVRFSEPLGAYNLRTYDNAPKNHVGWNLVVNHTFVTIDRISQESTETHCTP